MRYALIDPQNAINRFAVTVDPAVPTRAGWRWLPADVTTPPAYDPLAQKLDGPSYTVGADAVTESWTVVALTAGEIDALKEAAVAALSASWGVMFKALFNLNNRVRALEGQGALTALQFAAVLKALL